MNWRTLNFTRLVVLLAAISVAVIAAAGKPQHSAKFEKPKQGRIAVKVINHLGDEVMKVLKVQND